MIYHRFCFLNLRKKLMKSWKEKREAKKEKKSKDEEEKRNKEEREREIKKYSCTTGV